MISNDEYVERFTCYSVAYFVTKGLGIGAALPAKPFELDEFEFWMRGQEPEVVDAIYTEVVETLARVAARYTQLSGVEAWMVDGKADN